MNRFRLSTTDAGWLYFPPGEKPVGPFDTKSLALVAGFSAIADEHRDEPGLPAIFNGEEARYLGQVSATAWAAETDALLIANGLSARNVSRAEVNLRIVVLAYGR
jgi:hypothetical protein